MGVFGMCTIVIILYGPNQTQNIGRISLLITKNVTKKYHDQMREKGWKVIVIWECEINEDRLQRLISEIKGE